MLFGDCVSFFGVTLSGFLFSLFCYFSLNLRGFSFLFMYIFHSCFVCTVHFIFCFECILNVKDVEDCWLVYNIQCIPVRMNLPMYLLSILLHFGFAFYLLLLFIQILCICIRQIYVHIHVHIGHTVVRLFRCLFVFLLYFTSFLCVVSYLHRMLIDTLTYKCGPNSKVYSIFWLLNVEN